MKILTYNINGIRASVKKGILDYIKNSDIDIFCFQEVRADEEITREIFNDGQITLFDNLNNINGVDFLQSTNTHKKSKLNFENTITLNDYFKIYNCGDKKGYAGTMILTKVKPNKVEFNMGEFWQDNEGRTITCYFDDFIVVNAYIPNGESRLDFKMQYLKAMTKWLEYLKSINNVICVGDFNIAHNEIDLTHPKECSHKSVFLPMERKAFGDILHIGYIDCFRYLNPTKAEYTWRSYLSRQANFLDYGRQSYKYRIDYIISANNIVPKSCLIFDYEYSDHLPVMLDFEISCTID